MHFVPVIGRSRDATRPFPTLSRVYFNEVVETYPFVQTASSGAAQAICFYEVMVNFMSLLWEPNLGLTHDLVQGGYPSCDPYMRQVTVFVSLSCETKPSPGSVSLD